MSNIVRALLVSLLVVTFLGVCADVAWAGPGGKIAEAVFRTWPGRIVLAVVCVILLPLILYVVLRSWLGVRKTRKDLGRLANDWPIFEWKGIEREVRATVGLLYKHWGSGDLSPVADRMTADYYRSQQELLDRWREEGKRNVTRLELLKKVEPLWVVVESEEAPSQIRVGLKMNVTDYLESMTTRKLLKGKKKVVEDHEAIWWLVNADGEWLLHDIEKGNLSLAYAKEPNQVDTAWLKGRGAAIAAARSASGAAPFDLPLNVPPTEVEETDVPVAEHEHDDGGPSEPHERR